MAKPLHPEKYEELLKLTEEYIFQSRFDYMNPALDTLITKVKKARKEFDAEGCPECGTTRGPGWSQTSDQVCVNSYHTPYLEMLER